jgi:hypothetical protein
MCWYDEAQERYIRPGVLCVCCQIPGPERCMTWRNVRKLYYYPAYTRRGPLTGVRRDKSTGHAGLRRKFGMGRERQCTVFVGQRDGHRHHLFFLDHSRGVREFPIAHRQTGVTSLTRPQFGKLCSLTLLTTKITNL